MGKIKLYTDKIFKKGKEMPTHPNIKLYDEIYVPKSYENEILKHLILNFSSDINGNKPPLIMAIQGRKGEGKSFMIQKICEQYNIELTVLSASEVCGPNEGDAQKVIKDKYENICTASNIDRKFRAIVIDDFHLGIGGNFTDDISKTTNAYGLISYLMNLCDKPYVNNIRIPIYITGNNFTKTYPALTRNGRINFFEWKPTMDEKQNIVYYMFKKFYPDVRREYTDELVSKYPNKYVAFYQSVIENIFFSNFERIVGIFCDNIEQLNCDNIDELIEKYITVDELNISTITKAAEFVDKNIPRNYEKE